MNPDQAAALREPFPAAAIGKLPRGGIKLDYVGHAGITDRLLAVDPAWTWEPFALAPDGGPLIRFGPKMATLWIRLTVLGVTRVECGSVESGKADLEKELVSDALRRAAMRFGVALDLWSKEDLWAVEQSSNGDHAAEPVEEGSRLASDAQIRKLEHLVEERGLPEGEHGIPWPDLLTGPRPSMRETSGWIDRLEALPLQTPPPVRVPTLRTDPTARSGSETAPAPGEAIPLLPPDRPWNRRPFPWVAGSDLVERWWSVALAALPGVGPARLLTAAREIATERGLSVPAGLGDLCEPELVNATRLWMDTRADEKGTTT